MTPETRTARAILAMTLTTMSWTLSGMLQLLIHLADTPRRRRAANRSGRMESR